MISSKHVWDNIKSPQEVEAMEEPNILGRIYRAIYMGLSLLLDIRANQVRIAKALNIDLKADKPTTNSEEK